MDNDADAPRPAPEPAQTHESIAQQLHAVADDPQLVGAAGLLVGGVSPVAGLALGLKAAHDEQAMGQPTSLLTKFAIGRSAVGLVVGLIALVVFVIMAFSIMGRVSSFPGNVGNGPFNNFATCQNIPKPTDLPVMTWHCVNGMWTGTSRVIP